MFIYQAQQQNPANLNQKKFSIIVIYNIFYYYTIIISESKTFKKK